MPKTQRLSDLELSRITDVCQRLDSQVAFREAVAAPPHQGEVGEQLILVAALVKE